jgi:tryptophan synthase alpha chain
MGITGARADVDAAARSLVARLRAVGSTSACVGIGISTAAQVREVLGYADGAIVGSSLKVDGVTWNPVDRTRVTELMRVIEATQ